MILLLTLFIPLSSFAQNGNTLKNKVTQLQELQEKIRLECTGPNRAQVKVVLQGKTLDCDNLIVIAHKLQAQLDSEIAALKASCTQTTPGEPEALAQAIANATAQVACRPVSTDSQCLPLYACAALSIANPLGNLIGGMDRLRGRNNSCLARGSAAAPGCLQNVVKGIFDSLWGMLSLIWDIGKAGLRKIGEWTGLIQRQERSSSERLMAAQQMGPSFISRFIAHPVNTMEAMITAMFNGIKTAAMSSYGCEQWSGAPFISSCLRPMTNWNCASCQQKLQLMCGIAGFAIGEIGTALLTGGLAAGGKAIAGAALRGVKAGARAGKFSRLASSTMKFIPRPPAALVRATERVVAATARTLTATQRAAIKAYDAMKASRAATFVRNVDRRFLISHDVKVLLKPAAFYLDALEEASALGFRTVDRTIARVAGRTEDAAELARVATESRPQGLSDATRAVPEEGRATTTLSRSEVDDLAGPAERNGSDSVADDIARARTTADDDFLAETPSLTAPETPAPAPPSTNSSSAITVSDAEVAPVANVDVPSPAPQSGIVVDTPVNSVARTPAAVRATENPEDIIHRLAGDGANLEDREIVIDILTGKGKREEYFSGSNRTQEFRDRYAKVEKDFEAMNPAERRRLSEEFEKGADEVVAGGNERAARELDELSAENKIRTEDIDCNAMNAVYPRSFPGSGGKCKKVKFDEDVNGKYCACGALSKDTYSFLTRCPRSTEEFHTVFGFANGVALPSTSLPQACTRVNIPKGKECYFGSTSATYAGLGGLTQMLCLDDPSPRIRKILNEAPAEFKLQAGTPRIQPLRWSPFSDFDDLQAIIQRASTACKEVCDINIFRNLNRDYAAALERLERTTDPVKLARLEQEKQSFQLYMSSLRDGRLPTPNLSRAASFSDADRIREAGRITRSTLSPAQEDAIIRAHNVGGKGRGYFSYTQSEINEKARILREAGFDPGQVRGLMKNGIVGGRSEEYLSAADAFNGARSDAVTARGLIGNYREGADLERVKSVTESAAEGYRAEALRTRSPEITAEAWRLSARAGNVREANEMLKLGISEGMNPQRVFSALQEQFKAVSEKIAKNPQNKAALEIERDALKKILENGRQTLGLPPREIPNTQSPFTRRPEPQTQAQPRPEPQVQPQSQGIVVSEIPPRKAQDLATEYRLGSNGKTADPKLSAELYYRASDGAIQREMRTLSTKRETNFLADRNFGEAFDQSLRADGSLSLQMIDDIYAAGGYRAVNAFLSENFQRFNTWQKTPEVRRNLRQFIDHVNEKYGKDLFDPQRNYLRSWGRANYDEPISLTAPIREKVQAHLALTPEQESFMATLIQKKGSQPMSDTNIAALLDNQASFGGAAAQNTSRPFRADRITSFFPSGTTPDDVIAAYNRGGLRQVGQSKDTLKFQGEVNGNRYTMYLCQSETCEAGGMTVKRGEVTSVSPECGPGIRALPKLSKAKEILRQPGPITRDSFYMNMPCRD
ncbi:MAG: hypothetical protein ACJ76H_08600 [Bacteriovoracaceae bacterium]